jgi:hypothetical protein
MSSRSLAERDDHAQTDELRCTDDEDEGDHDLLLLEEGFLLLKKNL